MILKDKELAKAITDKILRMAQKKEICGYCQGEYKFYIPTREWVKIENEVSEVLHVQEEVKHSIWPTWDSSEVILTIRG